MTPTNLGIRTDNLTQALIPYLLLVVSCFILMLIYAQFIPDTGGLVQLWKTLYPFAILIVPTSAAQELFFRGYLIFRLKGKFHRPWYPVLFSSLLFALAHLMFPYSIVLVPGAFIMGLLFGFVYFYYPNLFLASLAHILLNYFIIPTCYLQLMRC